MSMVGEFLLRLAIALPLICGLMVGLLVAVRRGWLRLPGVMLLRQPAADAPEPIAIVATKALTPAARLAVVRFDGRDFLLGIGAQGPVILARAGEDAPAPAQPAHEMRRDV